MDSTFRPNKKIIHPSRAQGQDSWADQPMLYVWTKEGEGIVGLININPTITQAQFDKMVFRMLTPREEEILADAMPAEAEIVGSEYDIDDYEYIGHMDLRNYIKYLKQQIAALSGA